MLARCSMHRSLRAFLHLRHSGAVDNHELAAYLERFLPETGDQTMNSIAQTDTKPESQLHMLFGRLIAAVPGGLLPMLHRWAVHCELWLFR